MEIIKSIRTWKPSSRKKSKDKFATPALKNDATSMTTSACVDNVLIHQTSLNGNTTEHYVSIAGLNSVATSDPAFKVPASPAQLQRQTWQVLNTTDDVIGDASLCVP